MALKPLDRAGASMYLSEISDLVGRLLVHVGNLEAASAEWVARNADADVQAAAGPDEFSPEALSRALHGTRVQQWSIFDTFEVLLTGWARLSLILHPAMPKRNSADTDWRRERGAVLRLSLGIDDDTLLANRPFRDAWMHFDERMDLAFQEGWLGNRQQFVSSAKVDGAVEHSVRVIDVEGLVFHYRDQTGKRDHVAVASMKACLLDVRNRLPNAAAYVARNLPAPGHSTTPSSP